MRSLLIVQGVLISTVRCEAAVVNGNSAVFGFAIAALW